MKKTYITTMPNQIGAFLQASRHFADLGINITRVSYNKAVDMHTLFIDAEGAPEQLEKADKRLEEIGYLPNETIEPAVVLLEFKLRNLPGAASEALKLVEQYNFNISYIDSRENGGDYQLFKMGLFTEDKGRISDFIRQARTFCPVRVIEYDRSEKVFDNSIFYRSFISGLSEMANITGDARRELLVNANLAMQTLDERGLSPYQTFDSIYNSAKLISGCRGEAFKPRITRMGIAPNTEITLIEPDCGSNTFIIRSGGETLFIDCGFACYRREMRALFKRLLPDFDDMQKVILITHADVDHCGLLPEFDKIIASRKSAECLTAEYEGGDGFREQNPLHKPYIKICKLLTAYAPPPPDKLEVAWDQDLKEGEALGKIGAVDFGELKFSVYEGKGGHLPGEIVLIDDEHRIAFTGDIYVNIKGMTHMQRQYNSYAPMLMTSVDTDPALCARERAALMRLLEGGGWRVFGAHGAVKLLDENSL